MFETAPPTIGSKRWGHHLLLVAKRPTILDLPSPPTRHLVQHLMPGPCKIVVQQAPATAFFPGRNVSPRGENRSVCRCLSQRVGIDQQEQLEQPVLVASGQGDYMQLSKSLFTRPSSVTAAAANQSATAGNGRPSWLWGVGLPWSRVLSSGGRPFGGTPILEPLTF